MRLNNRPGALRVNFVLPKEDMMEKSDRYTLFVLHLIDKLKTYRPSQKVWLFVV